MMTHEQKYASVMKRISISMLILVACINVLLAGAGTLQSFFAVQLFPDSAIAYIITDLIYSIAYCASFILPVVFFYLISKNKNRELLDLTLRLPEKHTVLKTCSVICTGMSIVYTMAYLNAQLLPQTDVSDMFYGSGMDEPYVIVLMFLSTAIVPALVEELMFRGMIYKNLRPYGRANAIIISALLFGLMHQNPAQFVYTTAAGVVLATAYELTGSFWACVLLHFFNNFFSVLQQIWISKYPMEKATLISSLSELILFFLGLIFAVLWFIAYKKDAAHEKPYDRSFFGRFENTKPQTVTVGGKVIAKSFFNPMMIVFLAITVLQMGLILLLY